MKAFSVMAASIPFVAGCAHQSITVDSASTKIKTLDPEWIRCADYLKRFSDRVQIKWDGFNDLRKVYPPRGTNVTVKFLLDADEGAVTEIVAVSGSGDASVRRACIDAIVAASPAGAWNTDMRSILGKTKELVFTFSYE